jgi:ABC-type lipoprotein export system ATPase subunit
LTAKNSSETINLLRKSNREFGQAVTIVTHDEKITKQVDRVLAIKDDKIIEGMLDVASAQYS